MKRVFIFFIIIIFSLTAGCAANPAPQNNPVITIVNNTGFTVYFMFLSPVTDDHWGTDRLGPRQFINHGQSISISLPQPLNVIDRYDIMLITLDNDRYQKMNVQVSNNRQFVFNIRDLVVY